MNDWSWLLLAVSITLTIAAATHALLKKPDPKATMGWIAVSVLSPFIGPVLYFLFGINRVVTRAQRLAATSPFQAADGSRPRLGCEVDSTAQTAPPLAHISERVTRRSLLSGNQVDVLYNGEQTYPEMLDAIANADRSIYLTTYIFNTRGLGQQFIDALSDATERGVDVRVIIDGVGELTNLPRASTLLARRGVRVARFIPPRLIPPAIYINLRNHRKILLIDDVTAFTGGMNISHNHMADNHANEHRVTDVHFRLRGPIAAQIRQAFLEDWGFVTGQREPLVPDTLPRPEGDALARAIIDGPNEYLGQLAELILAMICAAQRRIAIMTPYFLPQAELIATLRAAVVRGLEITVILPGKADHPFVHWATQRIIGALVEDGVSIYYQPPPFAHTKLFLIDDDYALIGSANIDPRSLRLNFELGVEVFDNALAAELWQHFYAIRARSRQVTIEELINSPTLVKLRNAAAWVCSPYL